MKRLLMIAVLAAFGTIGCKSTNTDTEYDHNMPFTGASNTKAPANGVVQTQYRPDGGMGVQPAGGVTAKGAGVVPAVGTSTSNCSNGSCPTGTCPNTGYQR